MAKKHSRWGRQDLRQNNLRSWGMCKALGHRQHQKGREERQLEHVMLLLGPKSSGTDLLGTQLKSVVRFASAFPLTGLKTTHWEKLGSQNVPPASPPGTTFSPSSTTIPLP